MVAGGAAGPGHGTRMTPRPGLTFSDGGNAHALHHAGALEGIRVATTVEAPLLPLPTARDSDGAELLFFTEESSLRRALRGDLSGEFLPREFPIAMLDDKWAFATWLSSEAGLTGGLRQWSLEVPEVPYPCLVKAKRSWSASRKMPRGWICRSPADRSEAIRTIDALKLDRSLFFTQEWLGDVDARLVSVCGFHDAKDERRRLVAVVERLEASTPGLSCTSVAATIEDSWGLRERAWAILDRLAFTGPYEIEFLVLADRVLTLELNPRFWLQHGLFIPHGNGLMRRYLGVDVEADWAMNEVDGVLWMDGLHLTRSILRGRLGVVASAIRHCRSTGHRVVVWPPIRSCLAALLQRGLGRVRRRGGS